MSNIVLCIAAICACFKDRDSGSPNARAALVFYNKGTIGVVHAYEASFSRVAGIRIDEANASIDQPIGRVRSQ